NPQHPSSLVYATDVPHHAPILLGAMYIENGTANGQQVGGGLTRWHSHLVVCEHNKQIVAGFGVVLGGCNPAHWTNYYTSQMLHVWVVPYPGGPFLRGPQRRGAGGRARGRSGQDRGAATAPPLPPGGGAPLYGPRLAPPGPALPPPDHGSRTAARRRFEISVPNGAA